MFRKEKESMDTFRTEISEILITAETDLNSERFRRDVINLPIVILRKFLRHPNCDELNSSKSDIVPDNASPGGHRRTSIFSMDNIDRLYGAQKITVLNQDVDVSGFHLDDKNIWEKMPLRSFLLYLKGLHQLLNITDDFCVLKRQSLLDAAIVSIGSQSLCMRDKHFGGICLDKENSGVSHIYTSDDDKPRIAGCERLTECSGDVTKSFLSNSANTTSLRLLVEEHHSHERQSASNHPILELDIDAGCRLLKTTQPSAACENSPCCYHYRNDDAKIRNCGKSCMKSCEEVFYQYDCMTSLPELYMDCATSANAVGCNGEENKRPGSPICTRIKMAGINKDHCGLDVKDACRDEISNTSRSNLSKLSTSDPCHYCHSLINCVNSEVVCCQLQSLLTLCSGTVCENKVQQSKHASDALSTKIKKYNFVDKCHEYDRKKLDNHLVIGRSLEHDNSENLTGAVFRLTSKAYVSWPNITATDFRKVNQDILADTNNMTATIEGKVPSTANGTAAGDLEVETGTKPPTRTNAILTTTATEISTSSILKHNCLNSVSAPVLASLPVGVGVGVGVAVGVEVGIEGAEMRALEVTMIPHFITDFDTRSHIVSHVNEIHPYWAENSMSAQSVPLCPTDIRRDKINIAEAEDVNDIVLSVESDETGQIETRTALLGSKNEDVHHDILFISDDSNVDMNVNECNLHENNNLLPDTRARTRQEMNVCYAAFCREKRDNETGKTTLKYISSYSIGCKSKYRKRKRGCRRASTSFGLISPHDILKKKKFSPSRNDITSLGSSLGASVEVDETDIASDGSFLIWKLKLRDHRKIINHIMNDINSEYSVKKNVRVGASLVIVRLSALGGVLSLDLSFPPLGQKKSMHWDSFNDKSNQNLDGDSNSQNLVTSILYSPLDRLSLLEMSTHLAASAAASSCISSLGIKSEKMGMVQDFDKMEQYLEYWLNVIVCCWPPLCSSTDKAFTNCMAAPAKEAQIYEYISSDVERTHDEVKEMDVINTAVKVSDGFAMQNELLRFLRACPSSFAAILACGVHRSDVGDNIIFPSIDSISDSSESNSKSDTQSNSIVFESRSDIRSKRLIKNSTDLSIYKSSPPLLPPSSICYVSITKSIDCNQTSRSLTFDASTVTGTGTGTGTGTVTGTGTGTGTGTVTGTGSSRKSSSDKNFKKFTDLGRSECSDNVVTDNREYLMDKKKCKTNVTLSNKSKSSFKNDDLLNSKLDGIMKGKIKFCTNLDMSSWDIHMQVTGATINQN